MARPRTFNFSLRQQEIWDALDRCSRVLVVAGINGGKSWVGTTRCYAECTNYTSARAWYVGANFKLVDNCFAGLNNWAYEDEMLLHTDNGRKRIYFLTGSWVAMQSAVNAYRLRGEHVDLVVLDEGSIMSAITLQRAEQRVNARGGKILVLSNVPNPGEPGFAFIHDLFRDWLNKPDALVINYPSWEHLVVDANGVVHGYPGGRVDPKVLWMEAQMAPDEFERMVAASMAIRQGLVYPSFTKDIHVVPGPYKPTGQVFIFGDYGMNTACILWADFDGEQLVVFKEFYQPGVTSPVVIDHYKRGTLELGMTVQAIRDCYIDTANADLKKQAAEAGFKVEKHGKVDKSNKVQLVQRIERWLHQQAGMGAPKLRITSDCTFLLWELENLIIGKDGTLPKEDQPNHATDSLQYGLCGIESGMRHRGIGIGSGGRPLVVGAREPDGPPHLVPVSTGRML